MASTASIERRPSYLPELTSLPCSANTSCQCDQASASVAEAPTRIGAPALSLALASLKTEDAVSTACPHSPGAITGTIGRP